MAVQRSLNVAVICAVKLEAEHNLIFPDDIRRVINHTEDKW